MVTYLLEKGGAVRGRTWNGLTPTLIAALSGNFDLAHLLLRMGGNVEDVKDGIDVW